MKVILQIMNNAPPSLNKNDRWEQCFHDFVNDCLQKDPSRRPTIDQIFKTHKKFFAKARSNDYIRENFLMDLPEVYHRKDSSLIYQAEEYLSQKVKQKVKRVESDQKNPIQWDLTSGDHTAAVREAKANGNGASSNTASSKPEKKPKAAKHKQ
jgi:serine/threonine protein kinase